MSRSVPYVFKRADSPSEFDQIHALNHATFVREIPQHHDPGEGRLVDKFHDKNQYFVALRGERVVGMLSLHDQPPFSIASRLPDPALMDAPGMRPLEIRLLAVEPDQRASTVFGGLAWSVLQHVQVTGHTHLFISGFEDRLSLYEGLGFEPIGPAVGVLGTRFVPMCLPVSKMIERHARSARLFEKRVERSHGNTTTKEVCLLPGPVTQSGEVRAAMQLPPHYHRGTEFLTLFERVRKQLGELVGGRDVAMFLGSGTLANDVIAATLAAAELPGRGLILNNGEFGRRLVEQAERLGLQPRVLSWQWGRPWDLDVVTGALDDASRGSWVWGVHHESSTGMLNDLPALIRLAKQRGVRVCVDAVSSLGGQPLDLSEVFLASGSSGKALGACSGIALVFANRTEIEQLQRKLNRVPTYLDLAATLTHSGPRFTFPSVLLQALSAALTVFATPQKRGERFAQQATLGRFVRSQLDGLGLQPLTEQAHGSSTITTFAPPSGWTSEGFVDQCRRWGFLIGGQSRYLTERGLVQIATMGTMTCDDCAPLFERLRAMLAVERSER